MVFKKIFSATRIFFHPRLIRVIEFLYRFTVVLNYKIHFQKTKKMIVKILKMLLKKCFRRKHIILQVASNLKYKMDFILNGLPIFNIDFKFRHTYFIVCAKYRFTCSTWSDGTRTYGYRTNQLN